MIRRKLKLLLALLPLIVFDLPIGCGVRGPDAVFNTANEAKWECVTIIVVEDFVPASVGCLKIDQAAVIGTARTKTGQRLRFLMCCGSHRLNYCQTISTIPLT